MAEMKTYWLMRFSRKSGKIDTTLSALGCGMLQLWALQNTTAKTKDTLIFDEDGWVLSYYEGTGNFPKVSKYQTGEKHIDTFCEGLLDALKKMN